MCKVLENRAQQDEERMDQLTNQLKEARLLAEDADGKSDEVSFIVIWVGHYDGNMPSLSLNVHFKPDLSKSKLDN